MLKKKFVKLKDNETRMIYNIYIQTNKQYRINTTILVLFLIMTLLTIPNDIVLSLSVIYIFLILGYLIITKKFAEKWYDSLRKDPLKEKSLIKLFSKKTYHNLSKEEKIIVQQEYKKNENYSILEKTIFYIFIILSIILCIKKIISLNDMIYILLIALGYLIYDLQNMKKWYKLNKK